jgi:hypothetical protein
MGQDKRRVLFLDELLEAESVDDVRSGLPRSIEISMEIWASLDESWLVVPFGGGVGGRLRVMVMLDDAENKWI